MALNGTLLPEYATERHPFADHFPDDDRFAPPLGETVGEPARAQRTPIRATQFQWIDPSTLPKREWVFGRHLIRKFISCTVSPGGVGKSSLAIVEALSMVSGKSLLGIQPPSRLRFWYFNGEDPLEEIQRRVMAACLYFDLTPDDIGDRLFLDSGRDTSIVIAEQNKNGVIVARPVVDEVRATILENKIDAWSIDPFVSSHRVSENDNGAIDVVAKQWAGIANDTDTAGDLVHHARKTNGAEITVEDGRGAVALLAAVRAARVLNPMSKDEAERAGVDPKLRRLHFRVDGGKGNLAPPSDAANWYRLQSVDLGNGTDGNLDFGDSMGVVSEWEWPDPLASVTTADLRAAQAAVRAGGPWRENVQTDNWVGKPIAQALHLDLTDKAQRAKVQRLLKVWISTGMFVVVTGEDAHRKMKSFVEAGEPAND
ncbi:AAA family ATPase [Methylobacterium sp. J-059]|uniref:AAA family ATPase n=1 Tax=Methylobacterium sp. J-059 TaxID=2836643 RepID=UPI001FB95610|nr:AAA family ATPase [Methylobacterium sp. J-059]MCJ2039555.1 AAA family ATPase [Methylobacterium sp. J-059]